MRFGVDVALLVGFVAEFATREGPDYGLHSWIGVALVPIVAVHLAGNWRWIISTYHRGAAHPEWSLARFNALLAATTTICIATGFPIWLEWSDSNVWETTHTLTGFASILLALSHVWRNRGRLSVLLRRTASSL
ncbi:MAG: hypothetical protein WBM50_21810 [Acidimicrobiales bacterium]